MPSDPAVTHNLGVAVAAQGRHREALVCFEAALKADPNFVSAHYNRAVALMALDETRHAIEVFSRAAALEPQHYEAHRALGFLWLSQGERGRALDHFARTYEMRRGDDRTTIARKSLTTTARHKLEHDAEQFLYLSQRTRDRPRFELLARSYGEIAKQVSDEVAALSDAQADALGEDYNTPIFLRAAPEIAGGAVNERTDKTAQPRSSKSRARSPSTICSRRRRFTHCGGSCWRARSGTTSPTSTASSRPISKMVLRARCCCRSRTNCRRAFPEILGKHPAEPGVGVQRPAPQSAVDVHADAATVSVNFWVTPTEANLAPERGGLVICRAPPPADWEIKDYDADQARIVTFLEQKAVESLVVPYRENRAVLFRSRLFHHSDRPKFASSYENHRINLTIFYG